MSFGRANETFYEITEVTMWGPLLLFLLPIFDQTIGRPSKPHIVIILVDDLGWNDVSWHNSEVGGDDCDEDGDDDYVEDDGDDDDDDAFFKGGDAQHSSPC